MSFDWSKHAECLAVYQHGDDGPCNADRAAMCAEGKRLELLVEDLEYRLTPLQDVEAHCMKLQAENARLREALEGFALRGTHADTNPTNAHEWSVIQFYAYLQEADAMVRSIARAALEGKKP